MKYCYRLYGFHVESELEIKEAYEEAFQGEPDFRVRLGEIPADARESVKDVPPDKEYCLVNAIGMIFRVPGVAEYYVSAKEIVVHIIEDSAYQPIRTYLLGSAFGYAMILRHAVVLHGGAVAKYGKGVIITGESGAGKSTVANGLREREFAFIADDVCAISEGEQKTHINMAYPQQKLCRDAALKMGYDLSELIYINEERDKFAVRLKENYLPDGMDFDYLFEIVLTDEEALTIKKVEGTDKLMLMLRNIYRGEGAFAFWGMPSEYMKKCLQIASTIQVYQVARPKNTDTLQDILTFIETTVKG